MFGIGWLLGGDELGARVTLYVPGTRDVSIPLTPSEIEEAVRNAATFLSGLFGGATSIPARGFWLSREDGSLVYEQTTLVYAHAKRVSRTQRQAVFEYARLLKARYGQEAVSVEINGKLRFV